MVVSVAGFMFLKANGLLIPEVNEAVQLMVIYPFALWGSTCSDLDHHWESSPSKDIISRGINAMLHLTSKTCDRLENTFTDLQCKKSVVYKLCKVFDASHRSWQTHSDLTLAVILGLLFLVQSDVLGTSLGVVDVSILSLVLSGVSLGILAHLVLDLITPQGIWLVSFVVLNKLISFITRKKFDKLPEKVHIVPNVKFFATGEKWEDVVGFTLRGGAVLSLIYAVFSLSGFFTYILDLLPFEITFGR